MWGVWWFLGEFASRKHIHTPRIGWWKNMWEPPFTSFTVLKTAMVYWLKTIHWHVRDECDLSNASLMACRLPSRSSPSFRCGSIWCSLLAWIEQHRKTGLWFQLLYRKECFYQQDWGCNQTHGGFKDVQFPISQNWKSKHRWTPILPCSRGTLAFLHLWANWCELYFHDFSTFSAVCMFVHQVYGAQPHRGTHRSLQGVRIWGAGQIWVRLRCFPWLLCAKLYSKLSSRALIFRTGWHIFAKLLGVVRPGSCQVLPDNPVDYLANYLEHAALWIKGIDKKHPNGLIASRMPVNEGQGNGTWCKNQATHPPSQQATLDLCAFENSFMHCINDCRCFIVQVILFKARGHWPEWRWGSLRIIHLDNIW